MYNFYLQETSYIKCSTEKIEHNFQELNLSMSFSTENDVFLCSERFWTVKNKNGNTLSYVLFHELRDKQFMIQVMPYILNRISKTNHFEKYEDFKGYFANDFNAFWGICFYGKHFYEVRSREEFSNFKHSVTKGALTPNNFKLYNEFLFPKLTICLDVFNEIMELKDRDLFHQFIDQLEELNKFAEKWVKGNFELKKLNENTAITASGESNQVNGNDKLRACRYFKLPNGSIKYFENHIKTGDLRIYFLEDNLQHRFFVGYVGKHLPTAKFKK